MSYQCLITPDEFKIQNPKLFLSLIVKSMGAEEFDYAKDRVWDLPRTPENHELLELYK